MAGIDNNTILLLDGQTFKDISNNPKTIINNGITITDGKFDNSFYLNGTSNYLQISNIDFQNVLSNDFTFEFYINITSFNQMYPTPFSIVNGDSTAGRSLYIHTTSDVTAFTFGNGSNSPCIISTDALNVGEWYHVAMVRNGNTFKAFLNGSLVGEVVIDSFYAPSETNFYFGNLTPNNSSSYFNGKIDEVRVSNIARYNENFNPPGKFVRDVDAVVTDENIVISLLSEKIDILEILINDASYKTYKNVISNFSCPIDKSFLHIGNNEITIKTTSNGINSIDVYNYTFNMDKLTSLSSLKDVIDAQSICNNTIENCRVDLKNNLIAKGVECGDNEKISSLVDKVKDIASVKFKAGDSVLLYADNAEYYYYAYGTYTYYPYVYTFMGDGSYRISIQHRAGNTSYMAYTKFVVLNANSEIVFEKEGTTKVSAYQPFIIDIPDIKKGYTLKVMGKNSNNAVYAKDLKVFCDLDLG